VKKAVYSYDYFLLTKAVLLIYKSRANR